MATNFKVWIPSSFTEDEARELIHKETGVVALDFDRRRYRDTGDIMKFAIVMVHDEDAPKLIPLGKFGVPIFVDRIKVGSLKFEVCEKKPRTIELTSKKKVVKVDQVVRDEQEKEHAIKLIEEAVV